MKALFIKKFSIVCFFSCSARPITLQFPPKQAGLTECGCLPPEVIALFMEAGNRITDRYGMKVHGCLKRIFIFSFVFLGFGSVVYAGPTVIYGGDYNLPILDRQESGSFLTEAIIEIPEYLTIYDLDVGINVTHTNVFDLQIFIQSPAGTRLCLNEYNSKNEFFKGENYIQTVFDDEAPMPIEQGSAPFTGRYRPKAGGSLQIFDNENAYGLWRLQICDLWYWDTGSLESVQLIVSISETAHTVPGPSALALLAFGAGLTVTFQRRHKAYNRFVPA